MKTIYTSALCVLFIVVSLSFTSIQKENKTIATFTGVTESDFYSFKDEKNIEILFYDIYEDVQIDLFDDENKGKKFTITWVEKQIDEYDDDGEETGDKITVKSITSLEVQS